VAVCMAGGEREVGLLASELRMTGKMADRLVKIDEATIQRQCDTEFFEPVLAKADEYDLILSMACGAGVQMAADLLSPKIVVPGLNTRFIGVTESEGEWAEKCLACGDCKLGSYGGICPVTRCTKSLLNGPCGGAKLGKCEAADGRDCAWNLIYERLKAQDRLDLLRREPVLKDNAKKGHPQRQSAEVPVEEKEPVTS